MIIVAEDQAVEVLREKYRGQSFVTPGMTGTVEDVAFFEPPTIGQDLRLWWLIDDGVDQQWIRAGYMNATWGELREWCAQSRGAHPSDVQFWLEI
jgi:hypothetical protein